jgi:molybdopterin converting factor small subunit
MNIAVKLFMYFTKYFSAESSNGKVTISLEDGSTVKDLLNFLGIPIDESKLIVINGVSQGVSDKVTDKVNTRQLKEGDVVAVFPPVTGGG